MAKHLGRHCTNRPPVEAAGAKVCTMCDALAAGRPYGHQVKAAGRCCACGGLVPTALEPTDTDNRGMHALPGASRRRPAQSGIDRRRFPVLAMAASALVVVLIGVGAFLGVARLTLSATGSSGDVAARSVQVPAAAQPAGFASAQQLAGPLAVLPAQVDPEPSDVVVAYFSAVNDGEYVAAWALGGKNIVGGTYDDFVPSFADTTYDDVTVNSVVGERVEVELDATQTDGSHRYFAGTYTVQDGVIVDADIHRE